MTQLVLTSEPDLRKMIRTEVERAVEAGFLTRATQPKERFSQRQASQRHGISEPTLIKWRKQGKLRGDVINGRVFYTDADIENAFNASK